jgi:hypothetical protein
MREKREEKRGRDGMREDRMKGKGIRRGRKGRRREERRRR